MVQKEEKRMNLMVALFIGSRRYSTHLFVSPQYVNCLIFFKFIRFLCWRRYNLTLVFPLFIKTKTPIKLHLCGWFPCDITTPALDSRSIRITTDTFYSINADLFCRIELKVNAGNPSFLSLPPALPFG